MHGEYIAKEVVAGNLRELQIGATRIGSVGYAKHPAFAIRHIIEGLHIELADFLYATLGTYGSPKRILGHTSLISHHVVRGARCKTGDVYRRIRYKTLISSSGLAYSRKLEIDVLLASCNTSDIGGIRTSSCCTQVRQTLAVGVQLEHLYVIQIDIRIAISIIRSSMEIEYHFRTDICRYIYLHLRPSRLIGKVLHQRNAITTIGRKKHFKVTSIGVHIREDKLHSLCIIERDSRSSQVVIHVISVVIRIESHTSTGLTRSIGSPAIHLIRRGALAVAPAGRYTRSDIFKSLAERNTQFRQERIVIFCLQGIACANRLNGIVIRSERGKPLYHYTVNGSRSAAGLYDHRIQHHAICIFKHLHYEIGHTIRIPANNSRMGCRYRIYARRIEAGRRLLQPQRIDIIAAAIEAVGRSRVERTNSYIMAIAGVSSKRLTHFHIRISRTIIAAQFGERREVGRIGHYTYSNAAGTRIGSRTGREAEDQLKRTQVIHIRQNDIVIYPIEQQIRAIIYRLRCAHYRIDILRAHRAPQIAYCISHGCHCMILIHQRLSENSIIRTGGKRPFHRNNSTLRNANGKWH